MADKVHFEELVEMHSAELYRYLWRIFGDPAEAQDCLQDAFLRAFKAYGRLDGDANARAWLYKIATNCARTQFKKLNRQRPDSDLLERMADGGRSVAGQVADRQQLAAVHAAVMALPYKQRAALMLRKYQAMDYAEIAEALNCSEDSARANVYQGLKKLRSQLAEEV